MSRKGLALFTAMCVIWGIPYLLIKVAVSHISPPELVFGRTAIGAVLLLPLALRRGELRPLLARWRPFILYSLVEIALPWLLLSDAETHISSSLSGLLVAAVPLAGIFWLRLWGSSEGLTRTRWAGLLLGLMGVAAVLGFDLRHITLISMVEMAIVVACYALGPQILSHRLAELPSLGVVSGSLTLCALLYLPIAIIQRPAAVPTAAVLGSVIALGVICTALAFLIFFGLIAEVGPVRATVITYINPAVAVALGVALLHEPFTIGIGVGFALVLAGSVLATRKPGAAGQPSSARPMPASLEPNASLLSTADPSDGDLGCR
ncbi:MAG: DMT family transporter [Candidatus Dormibacteria bacterium]